MAETLQPQGQQESEQSNTWIADQVISWKIPVERRDDPSAKAEVQQALIDNGTLYVNRDGQVDHRPVHSDYPPLP